MRFDAHQSNRGFAERISEETVPPHCHVRKTSAFWSARRKQHALPGRQDIDPIDLGAKLLPWIFLTDIVDVDARMDFRFRLAGMSNVRLIGIEPRRRLVSDVFATDGLSFMMAGYRDSVTERAATFWYGRTSGGLRTSRLVFHGLFLLAADGKHVDTLLGITEPVMMHPVKERARAVRAQAI